MNEELTLGFSVNTYDIDRAGHMNNIVYVRWLEDLRNEFLNHHFGFEEKIKEGLYYVVVSTSIRYKRQLNLGDKPSGTIRLVSSEKGILIFAMKIFLDGRTVALAEQKCVLYDLKSSRMITGQ